MSHEQGYHINVAKVREPTTSWELHQHDQGAVFSFHYCNIYIGELLSDDLAREFLIDIRKRFPKKEFVVTMTKWELRGREIHG